MAEIVAFYSYKGGVGRSLALANTAVLLARQGLRVACIDFDLEAGGLHTIFAVDVPQSQLTVLDILASPELQTFSAGRRRSGANPGTRRVSRSLLDLTSKVGPIKSGGQLLLLPTVSEITRINEALDSPRDLPTLLGGIITQITDTYNPHFILIDSRTGFAELASPPIRKADRLVCVLRPNRQNADGLRMLLDILTTHEVRPEIFLLLSQVPDVPEQDPRLMALQAKLGNGRKFDARIPYDPDLAFEEYVAAVQRPHSGLAKSYDLLVNWLISHQSIPFRRSSSASKSHA